MRRRLRSAAAKFGVLIFPNGCYHAYQVLLISEIQPNGRTSSSSYERSKKLAEHELLLWSSLDHPVRTYHSRGYMPKSHHSSAVREKVFDIRYSPAGLIVDSQID